MPVIDNRKDKITIENIRLYLDYGNSRVKILGYQEVTKSALEQVVQCSEEIQAGKIICNCRPADKEVFVQAGFVMEGELEGFFRGEDALCMSYFMNPDRKRSDNSKEKDALIEQCQNVKGAYQYSAANLPYTIRDAGEEDIPAMIQLFKTVFSSYPTPVYDADYIRKTMKEQIRYKVAVMDGNIVGLASADMDRENLNAEMTDCATYPEYRGKGILSNLFYVLEADLKEMGFLTLYSLSRAVNPGVNIVLSKHNYSYKGRLIKNCNICGSFEDMNLWVKSC